jgi:hypothetical protein
MVASGTANLLANTLAAFLVLRGSTARIQLLPWLLLTALTFLASLLVSLPEVGNTVSGVFVRIAGYSLLLVAGAALVKPLSARDVALLAKIDNRLLPLVDPFARRFEGNNGP